MLVTNLGTAKSRRYQINVPWMRLNIQSRWLEKYAPLEKTTSANCRSPPHLARNAHRALIGQGGKPNSPNYVWSSSQREAVRKTTTHIFRALRLHFHFPSPHIVPVTHLFLPREACDVISESCHFNACICICLATETLK